VPVVTDYLAKESLQRLQDEFAAALRLPIRICAPDGEPVTDESTIGRADREPPAAQPPTPRADGDEDVPILLEGELLGRIVASVPDEAGAAPASDSAAAAATGAARQLRLMASVIARRWNRQKLLRTRIAELATMYRLTAEFTGLRDLRDLMDLVTRTVVEILGAKACTIRLLNDRQTELMIEAAAGLSPEYLDKGPILLSESRIDQEVVTEGQTVYIADMAADDRVLYPEEARREGIVSGLSAPLAYKGRRVGALRVYMAEAHEFDWYERSLLGAIAAQAAAAIVNARLYEEAVRGANLRRHVRLAGEVQRRMFPASPPQMPGLDIAATYEPCFELGGDFYDFRVLGEDNLGAAVCDVVGKGVRASLLMASIRASLRAHAASIYDMSEVMARVNRDLCDDTAISDFATLFYGVIDTRQRRFTYTNAGHNPPLLIRGGQICHLTTGGGVLGVDPSMSWRHDTMILEAGDVVLIHTDGLTDAMDFEENHFGQRRVERAALAAVGLGGGADEIARHVLWEMRRFTGLQTRIDDLTLIAIKVL